jgi:hypothetical protein
MDIPVAERLTVLENQRETIERQLNGIDHSNPDNLTSILLLHIELEEILYAQIKLLTENYDNLKQKLWEH